MDPISTAMHRHLMIAMTVSQKITTKDWKEAGKYIQEIASIKYELEEIALGRGFSQACKESIPLCRGDCCKWHFPRHLTAVDFFVAIYGLPRDKQRELSQRISENGTHPCPMLLRNGCFLSFEQRPVVCTDAYPCFHDQAYWEEKEKRSRRIKKVFSALSAMMATLG